MALDDTLALPFFDDDHRRFADDAVALGRRQAAVAAARRRRRRLPRAGQGAGRGGTAQGGGAAVAWRAASGARRAHALHRPRNPGVPRRARRFRLRHAGARHRLDLAVRLRGVEAPLSAAGARRQGDRGLRAVGARGRLRRRGAGHDRRSPTVRHFRLDGEKTWISNGGIADHYVVFARTGEAPGAQGLSAFVVDADTPGLTVAERIEVIAPHPLARLTLRRRARAGCEPAGQARRGLQGGDGDARHLPLDGGRRGAGLCPPRAARDRRARRDAQAVRRAARRSADDASRDRRQRHRGRCRGAAGLSRRLDQGSRARERVTREAAMAKMFATEAAQRVIDRAVQLHGGAGVTKGVKVEELYREIRALRIYEGATEVQKIVIAREVLKQRPGKAGAGGGIGGGDGQKRSRRYVRARQSAAARAMARIQVRSAGAAISRAAQLRHANGSTAGSRPGRASGPA